MSPVSAAARPTGSSRSPEDGSSATAAASPAFTTPERSQFSEYTDLDLLASRLAVENHDGSDYDVRTVRPNSAFFFDSSSYL
jgi:hypothetical protein